MYRVSVNRPAACSWSSPEASRFSSMLARRATPSPARELAEPRRAGRRRSSAAAIVGGVGAAAAGASSNAFSLPQSRNSSLPRVSTAQA